MALIYSTRFCVKNTLRVHRCTVSRWSLLICFLIYLRLEFPKKITFIIFSLLFLRLELLHTANTRPAPQVGMMDARFDNTSANTLTSHESHVFRQISSSKMLSPIQGHISLQKKTRISPSFSQNLSVSMRFLGFPWEIWLKQCGRLDAIADLGAIGMQAFDLTLRGHMPQGNIQVRNCC